jgi:uncharacterized membrane protein YcaP (DUF421 family)
MQGLSDLIHTPKPLGPVVWHTVLLFGFLIVALRLAGRRKHAEFGMIEVLMLLFLGTAVETSMVAGNRSLLAGFVSAATLLVLDRLLSVLAAHSERLEEILRGSPIELVRDGRFVPENVGEEGLTRHEILAGLRKQGYASLKGVRRATLEPNGEIAVIAE